MTKRNETLDIVRSLCAIYIIAIFHLNGYFDDCYQFSGNLEILSKMITVIALSGFTYISGFCLSKYSFINIRDVTAFYTKRLSRFYLLYLLAALSLYMIKYVIGKGWFYDNTQFVLTLVGLSSFYDPIPHTLWYFGMIMFFYMVTPLLNYRESILSRVAIFGAIFLLLFLYDSFFYVDNTMFLYFPVYFIGLQKPKIFEKINMGGVFISLVILLLIFVAIRKLDFTLWLQYMVILPGLALSLKIGHILSKNTSITKFLSLVSTASMVAYLFHRQVFGVACVLFSGSSSGPISPVVGVLSAIVLFCISYYVQISYNWILKIIKEK